MTNQTRSLFPLVLLFPLILASCGQSSGSASLSSPDPTPTVASIPLEVDSEGFIQRTQSSADGSVTLHSAVLSDSVRQSMEAALSQVQLKALPLSPIYNVSLFSVQGIKSFQNTVFALPKPLTDGATWSEGKVRSSPQPVGSVRLSFSVSTINPKDASAEELRMQNAQRLEEELKRRGLKLASQYTLSGCPVGLFLDVQAQEYDVTPGDWRQSGPCTGVKEFEARLKMNAADADEFQKKLIAESDPQLRLTWRFGLTYPIRRYVLTFEAEALWKRVQSAKRLGGRRKTGGASAPLVVRDVMQEAVDDLSLPSQWQERATAMITQVVQTFFEFSDPVSLWACYPIGPGEKCALLNDSWREEFPGRTSFVLEWEETQTVLTSETESSWAPFKKSLK